MIKSSSLVRTSYKIIQLYKYHMPCCTDNLEPALSADTIDVPPDVIDSFINPSPLVASASSFFLSFLPPSNNIFSSFANGISTSKVPANPNPIAIRATGKYKVKTSRVS